MVSYYKTQDLHFPKNSWKLWLQRPLLSYTLKNYINVIFWKKYIACKFSVIPGNRIRDRTIRARLSQSGAQLLLQFCAPLFWKKGGEANYKIDNCFRLKIYCYNNMDQGKTRELKSYSDLKYKLYSLHFKENILNRLCDLC